MRATASAHALVPDIVDEHLTAHRDAVVQRIEDVADCGADATTDVEHRDRLDRCVGKCGDVLALEEADAVVEQVVA